MTRKPPPTKTCNGSVKWTISEYYIRVSYPKMHGSELVLNPIEAKKIADWLLRASEYIKENSRTLREVSRDEEIEYESLVNGYLKKKNKHTTSLVKAIKRPPPTKGGDQS